MSERVVVEVQRELDTAPATPHSYLQIAARLLRLADASEAPEAKLQYVLLASLYQRLFERSADGAHHRSSATE